MNAIASTGLREHLWFMRLVNYSVIVFWGSIVSLHYYVLEVSPLKRSLRYKNMGWRSTLREHGWVNSEACILVFPDSALTYRIPERLRPRLQCVVIVYSCNSHVSHTARCYTVTIYCAYASFRLYGVRNDSASMRRATTKICFSEFSFSSLLKYRCMGPSERNRLSRGRCLPDLP